MKQLTLETLRTPIEPTAFVINHLTVSSISIVSTVSCTQIYRFSHSPVELERKRGGIGLRVRAVPTGGTDGREQTHRRTGPGGGAAGPTMREHRARGGPLPWLWPVYFDDSHCCAAGVLSGVLPDLQFAPAAGCRGRPRCRMSAA
jgi:hypothetical protein